MTAPRGRVVPLSLPRRFVSDLVHFGKKVPAVTVQRKMDLGSLVRARAALVSRPSWSILFAKAFGLVARVHAPLRRCFVRWPWPHFYEHPFSVASMAVERDYQGEPAVFFGKLRAPEEQSLSELDRHLRQFKNAPIETFGCFRRALYVSSLPLPLRRALWSLTLGWCGAKRAKRMGTFGVSVYAALGAASLNPISPLTATINYDVIQPDGSVLVRLVYDHRVMDGGTVARVLADMERILKEDIASELASSASEQTETASAA
jgi:hypothetical protein